MPDNQKKADIKQGDFLSYLAARGNAAPRPSLYQQIVAEKYSNVAESYRPQWDDSDAHLPENEEWKDLLARSVNDLEQAIRIFQQLSDNPPAVMTPMTLTRFKTRYSVPSTKPRMLSPRLASATQPRVKVITTSLRAIPS